MKTKGFTLLELLSALSIAVIVGFVGLPGLCKLIDRETATAVTNGVVAALAQARADAAVNKIQVSICASSDGLTCATRWGSQLLVFRDPGGEGELEETRDILRTVELESGWKIRWSAFGHKSQLTLTPQGYTKHQNGSFYLCPADGQMSRVIVVNKAARARLAPDEDGNGFVEKANGDEASC